MRSSMPMGASKLQNREHTGSRDLIAMLFAAFRLQAQLFFKIFVFLKMGVYMNNPEHEKKREYKNSNF